MNNDRHNLELEGLLAEVEHAGRNARRQQELGAMIDSMAETKSHGTWWWTVRVAAVACIIFFVVTAVRIWFIPTGNTAPQVAEVVVPKEVVPSEPATVVEAKPTATHRVRVKPVAVQPVVVEEEPEEQPVAEELPVVEQIEEPVDNQIEMLVQPVVSVEQPLDPMPAQPEPVTAKPQERKHSLLGTLIHRAEPSRMDGTILAFNIMKQ